MVMSNILKIILGIITIWVFGSSFNSLSKAKEKMLSSNYKEEIIKYIHSCEIRVIILLLFIIIQNMARG